jgi:RNA polymerase sigma-70 factor (ECF subfamily)
MAVRADGMQAWDEVRAHLLAFVSRRVENDAAAQDIVQDVLERFQTTDSAAITNVKAWLYRAARNAIVDHYRKRRSAMTLDEARVAIDSVDGGADAAEPVAAMQELALCLRPLIGQLPADYRSAVTLVDLDGLTQQAAARVAGISTSGMKSRVQRGRRQLVALLRGCCEIETTSTGAVSDYAPRAGHCAC